MRRHDARKPWGFSDRPAALEITVFRFLLATLLSLTALPAFAAEPDRTWRLGDTDIAFYAHTEAPDRFEDRLVFSRGGAVVGEVVDHRISLNAPGGWNGGAEPPPFGANLTGGTDPQVVVETYSGGAHCCFALTLYTLGATVQARPLPFSGNYGARFEKGADGVWRLIGGENAFAYWRASFAGSPAPTVVYRMEGDRLVLDEAAMRKPAPPFAELLADRAAWDWSAAQTSKFLPYELLDRTLGLIYSGHMDTARIFLDAAWNPAIQGKEEVEEDLFLCRLRQSENWPAIAALNHEAAASPRCP